MNKAYNRSLNCSSFEMLFSSAPIPMVLELTLTEMDNLIEDFKLLKDLIYVREGAKDFEESYEEKENVRSAVNTNDKRYEIGELVLKIKIGLYAATKACGVIHRALEGDRKGQGWNKV